MAPTLKMPQGIASRVPSSSRRRILRTSEMPQEVVIFLIQECCLRPGPLHSLIYAYSTSFSIVQRLGIAY